MIIAGYFTVSQQKELQRFVEKGGKVIVLPQTEPTGLFGVRYKQSDTYVGAAKVENNQYTHGISLSDVRYRSACKSWLIDGGVDAIYLNGLLGVKKLGKGTVMYVQIDPNRFNADSLTYFRLTRWRQTRALSQILTNAGAVFENDKAIFSSTKQIQNEVVLDNDWKAQMTQPLLAATDIKKKYSDPGISETAQKLMLEDADESAMIPLKGNMVFEKANPAWSNYDGEIVYRKRINIPADMVGKDLELVLDVVDDFDQVYINGTLVGKTGVEKEPVWCYPRTYSIPANVVKSGENVIAIRIFDAFGGGGIVPTNKKRTIQIKNYTKPKGMYHPDYIDDFELGDNPYRYFRW